MHDGFHVLINIAIVLLAAFLSGLIFRRFKQSIIVAYLISGIIIGPYGLGIIKAPDQIDILSEIGIILLMFILGLSFPPKKIIHLGTKALLGGVFQISFTVIGSVGFTFFLGWTPFNGFMFGNLLALSSTAIVIKVLNDSAMIDSLHARLMVSFLVVQDVAAILMIAILPSLSSGSGSQLLIPVLISLVKGIAFLIAILLLNRKLIPQCQFWVATIGGKELFLIGTIIFCLGMAIISQGIGLSSALGAFLAGLIVSESEFNYQILAGMVPFRDAFLCIFFVALGMLLDPRFFIHYPGQVVFLFLAIIIGKFIFTALATWLTRYPLKTAVLVGMGLAQMGEFSFILVKMGMQYNLVNEHFYSLSLTAALLTMLFTPLLIKKSPLLIDRLNRISFLEKWLRGQDDAELSEQKKVWKNHVILCGYGSVGITLGRVLNAKNIPFIALDLNAQTVLKMRGLGIDCFYGDATSPDVLKKTQIENARLLVITIPDPLEAEATVKNVKSLNPDCHILVRSRFSKEIEELYDYGADEVVQEEFETSLTILARALRYLTIEKKEIRKELKIIRIERDELTKTLYFGPLTFSKLLPATKIILDIKARTKEEAIKEIMENIGFTPKIHNKEELIHRILEREEIEVTSIGDGVAIPHARTNTVNGVFTCLGISRKGVDYGAIDGKPVHIIIILGASESAQDTYLNTLGSVAAMFNDKQFRKNIITCKEASQVVQLLRKREKTMQAHTKQ